MVPRTKNSNVKIATKAILYHPLRRSAGVLGRLLTGGADVLLSDVMTLGIPLLDRPPLGPERRKPPAQFIGKMRRENFIDWREKTIMGRGVTTQQNAPSPVSHAPETQHQRSGTQHILQMTCQVLAIQLNIYILCFL